MTKRPLTTTLAAVAGPGELADLTPVLVAHLGAITVGTPLAVG